MLAARHEADAPTSGPQAYCAFDHPFGGDLHVTPCSTATASSICIGI